MKIVAYDIVVGASNLSLIRYVGKKISEGWQPYGQPFMGPDRQIMQAIVKYAAE